MAQQHNNNRNSPHLNHLQNGSAPNSPSMSTSQQPGGQARQPVSYPSPTSYPSPSLQSAQYNYPPPNNQQVNEPYRASPTGSNGSMSLPSMRSLDPLQQQQQQQPQQHHMGSPLPPPVAQMGGPYYTPQGQPIPYPSVTSDPTGQMRYALPVTADSRVMSGGRHKKVGTRGSPAYPLELTASSTPSRIHHTFSLYETYDIVLTEWCLIRRSSDEPRPAA